MNVIRNFNIETDREDPLLKSIFHAGQDPLPKTYERNVFTERGSYKECVDDHTYTRIVDLPNPTPMDCKEVVTTYTDCKGECTEECHIEKVYPKTNPIPFNSIIYNNGISALTYKDLEITLSAYEKDGTYFIGFDLPPLHNDVFDVLDSLSPQYYVSSNFRTVGSHRNEYIISFRRIDKQPITDKELRVLTKGKKVVVGGVYKNNL